MSVFVETPEAAAERLNLPVEWVREHYRKHDEAYARHLARVEARLALASTDHEKAAVLNLSERACAYVRSQYTPLT